MDMHTTLIYSYNGYILSRNSLDKFGSADCETNYAHPNDVRPPIPYGTRFRKFRIKVIDFRKLPDIPNGGHGTTSMKLLCFAVDRLSALLPPAARQNTLIIEIDFAGILEKGVPWITRGGVGVV